MYEIWGVRCCSDVQHLTFLPSPAKCGTMFVSSRDSDEKLCVRGTTFYDAKRICESWGARICTVNENLNDCTRPAKCSLNENFVWAVHGDDFPSTVPSAVPSITPSDKPTSVPSLLPSLLPSLKPSQVPSLAPTISSAPSNLDVVVAGASAKWRRDNPTLPVARTARHYEEYGFRCCSEVFIVGFSASQCPQDLWVSSRDEDGICERTINYHDAFNLCQSLGGRLCTAQENADDCTKQGKCALNGSEVWTSTSSSELPIIPNV